MQSFKPIFKKLLTRLSGLFICLLVSSLMVGAVSRQVDANNIPAVPEAPALTGKTGNLPTAANRHYDQLQYFNRLRAYPNKTVPAGAYQKALSQANQLPQAVPPRFGGNTTGHSPRSINSSGVWNPIGPNGVTKDNLKFSGRANAVEIDSTNPNVIYIGTANGGVWKSPDAGSHWSPLTDNQSSLATGAIAIDPNDHNTIYVGTGEENFSADSYYGTGVLKSTDAGANWTLKGGTTFAPTAMGTPSFSKIIVDPRNSNNVIAGTSIGVFRSTDGGGTWNKTFNNPNITDMVADTTTNPITIYAGAGDIFGSYTNGIFKSIDGGATFGTSPIGNNYPTGTAAGRVALDISASSPNILYAIFSDPGLNFGASTGVFRTNDSGSNWSRVTPALSPQLLGGPYGDQGWYDIFLKIDPTNPDILYVGGVDVWKTTDKGANWTNLTNVYSSTPQVHPDQHNMTFAPGNPSKLYLVNDGGIWGSSDGGANFTGLNNGLATLQFYGGSVAPNFNTNPLVLGGAQDNSTERYDGKSQIWQNVTCGDGVYTAIDPNNPNNVFTDCQNGDFYASTDGGLNFVSRNSGNNATKAFITPFVMDPNNSARLLMGTTAQLYVTTNSGGSWAPLGPDLNQGERLGTQALGIAKTDSRIIYASANINHLRVSTDNGVSFPTDSTLPNRYITSIAIDPTNGANALVTQSGFAGAPGGHVWRTTNTGATLTDVSSNLPDTPVNSVLIDPTDPANTWYIGTDVGFFFTTNAGGSWSSLQSNLPKAPIFQLFADPQFTTLIAATHGRSMYTLNTVSPCAAPLTVSLNTDTAVCGTLRYALEQASSGNLITFAPSVSTIYVTSQLPPVKNGVNIQGSSCPGNPAIVINGQAAPGPGLTLSGNNNISGIKVTGFVGPQISAVMPTAVPPTSGPNQLRCVVAARN